MTNPLQDLQNRINTNTLTFAQQSALSAALTVIIPLFPGVDETTAAYPIVDDEIAAREMMGALYSLQAQASGVVVQDPRTVTQWWVSTSTGSDSNPGTLAAPLKTFAALSALWRGAQPGGGRPTLTPATGTTITINQVGDHDVNDPLSVVLDVDLAQSTTLLFVGGSVAVHSGGTLATASAFARTSGGGQVIVTSASVPDFSIYFGLALDDTTKGTTGWIYGPDGSSSANGQVSASYTSQTPGNLTPPTRVSMAAGDAVAINRLQVASLGSGWTTRSYPETAGSAAQVIFYRLALSQATVGDTVKIASPSVTFLFQECSIEGNSVLVENSTAVTFLNSPIVKAAVTSLSGSVVEALFGGGCFGGSFVTQLGGELIADADVLVSENGSYQCQGGTMILGAAAKFGNGPAVVCQSGGTVQVSQGVAGVAVVYGTNTGACVEAVDSTGDGATITYFNDTTGTPAQDAFKLSTGTLIVGLTSATNAFGFNEGTGAYVGPTTTTLAHLDAALGAGTGFGGTAIDPATGCSIRIAA